MTLLPLLIPHIGTAGLSLLTGSVAMVVLKGGPRHRSFGTAFCIAMLVMSGTAVILATITAQGVNLLAGTLTFYMVATGWLAVRNQAGQLSRLDYCATPIGLAAAAGGLIAASRPSTDPASGAYIVFGAIAALAVAGDIVTFIRGGARGTQRLRRHLWRVGFGFLITVVSFFIGKADLLPKLVRQSHLNDLPVIWVMGMLIVWTVRLSLRGRARFTSTPGFDGARANGA